MGILDPLFSLRHFALFPHTEASLGFRETEKREKESARGDAFPSSQRSPRVYNFYFYYYCFFFSWNPWGSLCLGETELCSLFCFRFHLV